MEVTELIGQIANMGLPSVLVVFLIWNNAKLIDRIISKLIENGANKKK